LLQSVALADHPPLVLKDGSMLKVRISLYSVNPVGTTNWTAMVGDSGNYSSPVIGLDGSVYMESAEMWNLSAFGAGGTQRWIFYFPSSPGDSAAIGRNGTVYISAGPLYAFTPDGTNLWAAGNQSQFDGPPVIGKDGTIYAAGWGSHTLFAITRM